MLFYNEEDEICIKSEKGTKVLYDWDIVQVNSKLYTYSNGYFYDGIDYGDGDYETDWESRTHPRHMGILEMSEINNLKLNNKLSIGENHKFKIAPLTNYTLTDTMTGEIVGSGQVKTSELNGIFK